MQKVCRRTALAICGLLAALTIVLVLPGLFGIHPLNVKSGSMDPLYPQGSLLYMKDMEQPVLREGEVVSFYLPDEETLVTHRIVRIDWKNEMIYTKGDANESEDGAATPFSRVIGKPVLCLPVMGHVAGYLSSQAGKVGIFLLVILVCVLSWLDGSIQGEDGCCEQGQD